jgi:hypothetical protein
VRDAITGAVAFSPDGAKLLVLCAGQLTTYDLKQGCTRPVEEQMQTGVLVCSTLPKAAKPCFSPDGKWLAVVLDQQHVCIYSTAVGGQGAQQQQQDSQRGFAITSIVTRAFNSVYDNVVQIRKGTPPAITSSIRAYCSSAIEGAGASMETYARSIR